ncbi:hypothetical protein AAAV48_14540 [Agathobaculum butyriciproducens]
MQGKEIVIGYKTFTAIIVAIVLCILIRIIYWLCTQGLKPELSANCSQKCRYLLKKDFIYMSVIAGIIIVVLLALTFTNDKEAVNYFSFAGTLSSIILSVVAIFMTINSENESKDAKRQMDMSVQQLKDTAASVEKLWKNTVDDFQKKMDEQTQNMEITFQQSQETYDLFQSLNEKMDEQTQNMKKVIDQSQKIYDQYQSLKIKIDEAFPAENLDKGNERWNAHIVESGDQQ